MYVDTSCSDAPAPVRMQRAEGRARIAFRLKDRQTRLERLFQEGCAKIRLPRPLPGGPVEAILINTAGGLTGGDRLDTEATLAEGAAATITTQACERVYRSTGDAARVATRLSLRDGASLAWLPQETILFDGARLERRLDVNLGAGAELLAVEAVLFGRRAMTETVRTGAFHDRWRIRRDGKLLFADDLRFDGEIADTLARPAVLGGRVAMATLFLACEEPERLIEPLRAAIGDLGGASVWGGKLVARIAAPDGLALRRVVEPALAVLMRGRALPKVWQL